MSRYVATDWHGRADVADKVFEYLKEDDELYYLGDAIDRGPSGIYITYKLLQDPRVVYLKGNHEDMLVDVISYYAEGRTGQIMQHWLGQGGDTTWHDVAIMPDADIWRLRNKLKSLPERIDLTTEDGKYIILSHAGCDPWIDDQTARMWGIKDRYLWDRKHLHSSSVDFKQEKWKDTYVIHGHTPVLTKHFCGDEDVVLPGFEDVRAVRYADGHKICLDLYTVGTGKTVLFDLDTFEEIYFTEEGIVK